MTLTVPPDLPRDFEVLRNKIHDLERRRDVAGAPAALPATPTLASLIVASQMYGNLGGGPNNWPGGDAPFDPYGSPWGGIYTRDLTTPQAGFGAWVHMAFFSEVADTDNNEVQVEFVWGTDPDVDFGYTQMFFARDLAATIHRGVVAFFTCDSFVHYPGTPFEPTLFMIPSAGWHQEGPSVPLYDDYDTADLEYSIATVYFPIGSDGTDCGIQFRHRVQTKNGDPQNVDGHTLWIRTLADQDLNALVLGNHGTGHSGLSPTTADSEFFFVTGRGDAVWSNDAAGPVFKDRTTGDFYRLLVDSGGAVSIEAV